jgi:hypothetical protein
MRPQWIRNENQSSLEHDTMRTLAKGAALLSLLIAFGCATATGRKQAKKEPAPDPFFEERAAAMREFAQKRVVPAIAYMWGKVKGNWTASQAANK